jgi:hypothetical protein
MMSRQKIQANMDQCIIRKKSKYLNQGSDSKNEAAGFSFGCANGNGSGEWWCGGADEVVVVGGRCVCKREAGGGLGSKTTKTSVAARFRVRRAKRGCRTMGGGGGVVRISWWWWWGGAFASARREDGLEGKKPRNRARWLDFGYAV